MKLKVLVQTESPQGYVVRIPSFPGCTSHGRTVAEAMENLKLAASTWLEQAMTDLDVEIKDEQNSEDDQHAMEQALAVKVPREKLARLAQSHPPPASWYQEDFQRPAS